MNNLVRSNQFGSTRTCFVKIVSFPWEHITDIDRLETLGVEVKYPSAKLDQSINDVLKDKKFDLEKANGMIQMKRSQIFLSNSRTDVLYPIKKS